ncbi:NAD-dependent epimerase/dehydratase [Kribbella flavida DSM 17836]|uniref:NAD-dependent epimerase/dehydratase n=1 Tax=Kribbella flavida (strain DSM 17836 / JCM 10339 / NBRC 14399) TaxID=479435 RepID=D2PSJ9_KRIFD|nr:NAD-dependent epimerase/dehydratase family protein [Kribbella flavida]ADB33137.1 NAD-dependent epimerase/dehydratase [Kribbella flavida DSM 17836]
MKIFLTGATGYIGSVIAEKLLHAGHEIVGLARSDESADTLADRGITPYRGDVNQPDTLTIAARAADGTIHTAFDTSSGDFSVANAGEAKAVDALIAGLQGSGKPLVLTSGTGVLGNTGDVVYDEDTPIAPAENPAVKALQMRLDVERAVLTAPGLRGVVLRPPNVYGRGDGEMVFWMLRAAAQRLGAVPYAVGTELNQWSFVHVDDLADLFVLAVEKAPGGELFHAGAQTGLRTGDIATAISHGMGLGGKTTALDLAELEEALGMPAMAHYWAANSQSSGGKARRVLGWSPQHLDLVAEVSRTPV